MPEVLLYYATPFRAVACRAALLSADMNAILGATMIIGVIFLFLNLLADILYSKIDPRIS